MNDEKVLNEEKQPEQGEMSAEEKKKQLAEQMEELRRISREAQEAQAEGKGVLRLEKPINVRDHEVKELTYDFTVLSGLEYTSAMDGDPNSTQIFRITYRQALALFAKSAAKQTEDVDERDILEQIGLTDAVEGVQLATLFFNAATRAGRMRISKKSSR